MWTLYDESIRRARKDYECQAWIWLNNDGYSDGDLTEAEEEIIDQARKEGFKILKGTRYIYVRGIWEGEWLTYRARLDLTDICMNHELFDL